MAKKSIKKLSESLSVPEANLSSPEAAQEGAPVAPLAAGIVGAGLAPALVACPCPVNLLHDTMPTFWLERKDDGRQSYCTGDPCP